MIIFDLRFINFRFNSLSISIFISLFIHVFTILILFKKPISTTKGDKYIPIELITMDSYSGKGESLKKNLQQDLLKIQKNNKNNELKELQSKKLEQKENIKTYKKEEIDESDKEEINKIKKEKINLNSSNKTQIKTQRGNKSDEKQNDIPEKGSVKGNSKIEITCLRCISPKYPTRALRRGAEGKPLVKVWINKLGSVTKSELIKSSGNISIDKAALLAAKKSVFYPLIMESTLKIEYELKIKQ